MRFADIIGQSQAVGRLRTAIDRATLPHAMLIDGREGTGGLAVAVAAAQYLQCERRGLAPAASRREEPGDTAQGEPCGECLSCRQYATLTHPDLHFVYPIVNKGTSVSPSTSEDYLADWRRCLIADAYLTLPQWMMAIGADNKQGIINQADSANIIRHLSVKPYESEYRVMIIWLPEKMNETAANKLLKIIEEPYEKTHFFLVSEAPDLLLGTIRSRTQRLALPPIDETDLAAALTARLACDAHRAAIAAHMAHGSWVEAVALLHDDDERDFFFTKFCEMMRQSYARKLQAMKDWSDEMAAIGRERQKNYLQYAQRMIRENFIMNVHCDSIVYLSDREREFSSRFSPFVNHRNVEGIVQELSQAESDIAGNVSAKMVFFDLSLKLIMLLKNAQ